MCTNATFRSKIGYYRSPFRSIQNVGKPLTSASPDQHFSRPLFFPANTATQVYSGSGIANLAAFLAYSWSMVVLYSDVYLEKLWTVYEIASFLLLFPRGRLHVRPVYFPKLVLSGMTGIAAVRLVAQVVCCITPGTN